jgi:CheY-like chemotaxis protein
MRSKDGRLFSAAHNPKVGGSNPPPRNQPFQCLIRIYRFPSGSNKGHEQALLHRSYDRWAIYRKIVARTFLALAERIIRPKVEEAGYAVLSATDETEALEVLREAPVCLVLSDHMLRGTTGTELAKQMKKIKRDVPIIVYSGTVPETMRHVDGFINKDEPVSNFLSLIHEFVKRYWE